MRRNKVTLLWLFVMVVVTLIVWLVPNQFEPVQVESQDDAPTESIMEWESIDFMLNQQTKENAFVRIEYRDNKFNHLLTDTNSPMWYMQSVYNEVYDVFPITDRPDLREYQIINANDPLQFWYQSPYLRDQNEEPLTFAYTIVDKENADYTEMSHSFSEGVYSEYYYLSYAEDEVHFYILLGLYNKESTQTTLTQLTIDKVTGEVIQDDIVEYEGEHPYALSTFYQNEDPSYHVMGIEAGDRTYSQHNYASLSTYNNQVITVLDPATLEFTEIDVSDMKSINSSGFSDTALAMINGDNLYFFKHERVVTDEEVEEELSNEIKMYLYDWQEDAFTEIWTKEIDINTRYTIQSGQLYFGKIDDEKQAHIEHIDLDSGEVVNSKEFMIDGNSDYQFVSMEFGILY